MEPDPLERAAILIGSQPQDEELIPDGEFCRNENFLKGLDPVTVKFILIVMLTERPGRSSRFSMASESALIKHLDRGDPLALDQAVALGAMAVFNVLRCEPMRGVVVSMFGRALRTKWEAARAEQQPAALDLAVDYLRKAVEFGPMDHETRALHLDDLGDILTHRYKLSHSEADYGEASKSFEDALATGHPGRAFILFGLGKLQREKAVAAKDNKSTLFQTSIHTFKMAIDSVTDQINPTDFRFTVADIHYELAATLLNLDDLVHDDRYVEDAKIELETALVMSERDQGPKTRFNCYVALAVIPQRLSKAGNIAASTKAAEYWRRALRDYPNSVTALRGLADTLLHDSNPANSREIRQEVGAVLARMTELQLKEPVAGIPSILMSNSFQHDDAFRRTGNLEEVNAAIKCLQDALSSPNLRGTQQPTCFQMLGETLLDRFRFKQDVSDLQEAAKVTAQALAFPNVSGALYAQCMRSSGRVSFESSQIPGGAWFLDAAILAYRRAITFVDDSEPVFSGNYCDLGNALIAKFDRSGDVKYASEAAQAYQLGREALMTQTGGSMPAGEGEDGLFLHGLGNAALCQFKISSKLEDIDTAIKFFEKCVEVTDAADIRIASRTHSLSYALQLRYDLSGKVKDVKRSEQLLVGVLRRQLNLAPVIISSLENMFGTAHLRYYLHDNELNSLVQAEELFKKALSCGCTDKSRIYTATMNLSRTLQYRAKHTSSVDDLGAALAQFLRCTKLVSIYEPNLGILLVNLAELLISVWRFQNHEAGRAAATCYMELSPVLCAAQGLPRHAISWMKIHAAMFAQWYGPGPRFARNFIRDAIEDIPYAVFACTTREDQLGQIRKFQLVPGMVLSIFAGDSPIEAIQLYERSRCVIWESILNKKDSSGMDSLREKFPDLAQRLAEGSGTGKSSSKAAESVDGSIKLFFESQNAYKDSMSLQGLLQDIRSKPGFEDFLRLPKEETSFHKLAARGAITIVQSDLFSGFALVITAEKIHNISLPNFTFEEGMNQESHLREAFQHMGGADANKDKHGADLFHGVLKWLWESVAEPVLNELGYAGGVNEGGPLPRLWWLTTSSIRNFPMHAAGDYIRATETGKSCTVLDCCISSYINTLRALSYARRREDDLAAGGHTAATRKALLVQMPETPYKPPLPCAAPEIETIVPALKAAGYETHVFDSPECEEVRNELLKSNVTHFACHAEMNSVDPTRSGLLLKDWFRKTSDGAVTRLLDVRKIMSRQMKCALVYVGACTTAVTGDLKLPEESIHLAAGFQMAGVPCVVGSLWKVDGGTCKSIAETFYREVLKRNGPISGEISAKALRVAVLKQRRDGVDPRYWASWVHYGP